MEKLKLGIIGCGWFAPFHVNALRQLDDRVEVLWTADPDAARAASVAASIGARPLADYRAGLAEVDAVDILVPHHLHHPIAVDCLSAGKHVLLEKPIATTLREADDIIAAAERSGRTFMVAYPHRYRPSLRRLKQEIESGKYGRLFMLDAMMDESLQAYSSLGWIAQKATLGGGVLFSASPHMLDPLLWIGGPVRSMSMVGAHAGVAMEGEDTAISIIKFAGGAIGTTRHTWASPRSRAWYTLTATCERAHLILTTTPLGDLQTEGHRCPWRTRLVALGETEQVLLDSGEGLDVIYEMQHFLDCVATGATPQTDGRMARRLIELVLAAYADAATRGAND
jgi:predicted dehydrogenase